MLWSNEEVKKMPPELGAFDLVSLERAIFVG